MTSNEIQNNVEQIIKNFSKDEFIFDLLIAYGISKTSITRLKKGDFNLSKNEGEVLYKKKVFFKVEDTAQLLSTVERISKDENITKHNPRFAIVTDYDALVAKDLKLGKNLDIKLKELPNFYDFFLPLAGAEAYHASNDNEADRNAAYKMGILYDDLVEYNDYNFEDERTAHNLNVFLSRLLFCFFAEDTGIFDDRVFTNTLVQHTMPNGSDTHLFLNQVFAKLNTEKNDNFPNHIAKLPYVNGGLFGGEHFDSPKFNTKAHKTLVGLGELDWKNINPDIFGSMIQAVVRNVDDDNTKHYTSVPNILKVIKPLFLDELEAGFEKAQGNVKQLRKLINRISKIKFFDPACGSGNFLIIAYKEIRLLEIKILQSIIALENVNMFRGAFTTSINLNQFYGIELDDFAHEMAILSLWLAEHQMNLVFEEELAGYGKSKPLLPLTEAGQIIKGNAARLDWKEVCPIDKNNEVFILGNPPYQGYSGQSKEQKSDMALTFAGINNYKKLDYIACWFFRGTEYIQRKNAKYAFVTTNSITQGEQVALLWPHILGKEQEIFFAYQSYKWSNNAKGNAGVAVVILGIRNIEDAEKVIFKDNIKQVVKNISPYLTNNSDIYVFPRNQTISKLPSMIKGSSPGDNGNLLLTTEEKEAIIDLKPELTKFFKKYIGAKEFIGGYYRYCIHITEDLVDEAYQYEELTTRFTRVAEFRNKSTKESTVRKSQTPHFFDEDKYRESEFILIPQTGSERRDYVPIGYFDNSFIPSNGVRVV